MNPRATALLLLALAGCGTTVPASHTTLAPSHTTLAPVSRATRGVRASATSRPTHHGTRPGLATSQPVATSQPTSQPAPFVPTEPLRCGSPVGQRVALTFDDGPSRFTARFLAVLRRRHVRATFFVLGRLARRHPDLIRKIQADGHLIANHSYNHPLTGTDDEWRRQIQRTEEAIRAAGAVPARYFRPPHGKLTPQLRAVCRELGYTVVLYTLLSSDWQRPGVEALVRQVTHRAAPGGVVVLHDAGGDRHQTLEALPQILDNLKRNGLRLVPVDELLGPRPQVLPCARPRVR